jgi:hypothetical protein
MTISYYSISVKSKSAIDPLDFKRFAAQYRSSFNGSLLNWITAHGTKEWYDLPVDSTEKSYLLWTPGIPCMLAVIPGSDTIEFVIPFAQPEQSIGLTFQAILDIAGKFYSEKVKVKKHVKEWKKQREKSLLNRFDLREVESRYYDKYIGFHQQRLLLSEKYSTMQGGNGTVIPDTFLVHKKGGNKVFTAALCPEPTYTLFPPVQYYILYKNPNFHSGGAKAALEKAPLVPAETVHAALSSWLQKESLHHDTKILTEETLLVKDPVASLEAFEKLWKESKKASLHFGDVEEFRGYNVIETGESLML